MKYTVTSMLTGTQSAKPHTPAEEANTLFAQLLKQVPGVVRVESSGGETSGEQAFQVYVRPSDLDAEYGVYQAECDVYHKHPEARLDVVVLKQLEPPEEPQGGTSASR